MNHLDTLLKKIEDRTYSIWIIGLRYVGLTLIRSFHQNDMPMPFCYVCPHLDHHCEHAECTGKKTVEWNKETVSGLDAAVISTNHSTIDYAGLAEWSECVVDTRNVIKDLRILFLKHN